MSNINPIAADDRAAFAQIVASAYPVLELHTAEARERFVERLARGEQDPLTHLYGCYRDGVLLGGMRLFDFTMNAFGHQLPIGGVGMVATDIAHKKQGVARDLISFYLRYYRERGTTLATLYPFRLDFYKQMGFGYGTKLHQYRLKPAAFPAASERRHVRLLTPDDKPQLAACYQRVFSRTHGLYAKRQAEVDVLFDTKENRVVGYFEDGVLYGYSIFQFRMGPVFIYYDIEIREFIYETRAALAGLLGFINSQADQVQTVIFNTHEPHFHHLFADPRNGSGQLLPHAYHESHTTGVGLMYRVLDTAGLFSALAGHNFGGQSIRLKITLSDSFLPEHAGSVVVNFADGWPLLSSSEACDGEIRLDVSEFSSLVLGVTPFRWLYHYRLAEVSDPALVPVIDRLFASDEPPVCCTRF